MIEWYQTDSGIWVQGEKPKPPRPRAIDLFAGCGGFSLGVESGGIDVAAAVEWEFAAASTYLHNLGHKDVVVFSDKPTHREKLKAISGTNERRQEEGCCRWFWHQDICKLTGEEIIAVCGRFDVVIGSPPCQGMSPAGMKSGGLKLTDPRNSLTLEYVRLVKELRPRCWVMENVPQLYTIGKGSLYRMVEERMTEAGYTVTGNIVDACDYGVPQHRRRAIVMGTLGDAPLAAPMPTHWPRVACPDGSRSFVGFQGKVEPDGDAGAQDDALGEQQLALWDSKGDQ